MNFDEMKSRWDACDRKLDIAIRLSAAGLHEARLGKARTSLQRLSRWAAMETLINFALVFLGGLFIARHGGDLKFLLPAMGLELLAILLVVSCMRQFVGLASLDPSTSIVEMQRKIETLRFQRLRINKWAFMLAPLLWVPLMIVVNKGVAGVDIYAFFSAKWLIANVIFGVAFIPLMLWVSRRYGDRMKGWVVVKRLMDDLSGRHLASAAAFLAELASFERESERSGL